MKSDRAAQIRQILYSRGHQSIAEIAQLTGASEPTIRRDLIEMEAAGLIRRSHGGAEIAAESGVEIAFEIREQINLPAKRAIGEAAWRLLRPETSVFLDAGTTVLQLARRIRLNPFPLRVFTNCLPVAQVLMAVQGVSVTLLGGMLRHENASTVGLLAEEALGRLWFDQLFLGAGGIDAALVISSADAEEARLNRLMRGRAGEVLVLADGDKFGRRLTYEVAPLARGMRVISDRDPGGEWRDRLDGAGVALELGGR